MNTTLFGGVSAWDSAGSSTSGTPTNTSTGFGAPAPTPTYSGGVSYTPPIETGFGSVQPTYVAPVYYAPTVAQGTGFGAPAATPTYSTGITQETGFNPISQQPTPTYSGGVSQTVQPATTVPVSTNNIDYRPVQNNTSYAYSSNPMSFAALPGLPGSETPAAPIQNRQSVGAAVLPQQNNLLNIGGGNTSVNSGGNVSAQAQQSQPITWGQNVGGTFYDTSGQLQGAYTLDQIQQLGGQTADATGYHSIAQTAQAYAAQAAAAQKQKQQGQAAFGIAKSSGGSGAAGNSAAMAPYNAALTTLAQLQNQLASGKNSSGQPLGYYDRQEIQTQISQLYNQTMAWNTGDEQQLAKVMDEKAKAEARAYLNNPTTYNGVVNSNEYQKMTLQATYGLNAQQVVADGGHAGWGAGDQQLALLQEAQRLGVGVPTSLLAKAGFDSQNWDQSQQIYNPAAGSPGDAMSWNTGLAYNSMGVGAGQGYTNNDAAYGSGGIWNPAVWGSYYEPGGGYDSQYGGANGYYNYLRAQEALKGGFASYGPLKPMDPIIQNIGTSITPGINSPGTGGNYMGPGASNGYGFPTGENDPWTPFKNDWIPGAPEGDSTYYPPGTDPTGPQGQGTGPDGQPMIGDQSRLDAFDSYTKQYMDKLKAARDAGGPNAPGLSDINAIQDNFNRQRAILEKGTYSPSNAYAGGGDIPGYPSKYINNDQSEKAYQGGILDTPNGGAVGAPGTLSTSNPNKDVFSDGPQRVGPQSPALDYTQSTRIDNSGLLDGMIQGQINGGDKAPASGWAQVYNQNVADQTAALRKQSKRGESGLLNAILSAYH